MDEAFWVSITGDTSAALILEERLECKAGEMRDEEEMLRKSW